MAHHSDIKYAIVSPTQPRMAFVLAGAIPADKVKEVAVFIADGSQGVLDEFFPEIKYVLYKPQKKDIEAAVCVEGIVYAEKLYPDAQVLNCFYPALSFQGKFGYENYQDYIERKIKEIL